MKKTMNGNYDWRLTLMKQAHPTVTRTMTPTWTLKLTEDMTKMAATSGSQGT